LRQAKQNKPKLSSIKVANYYQILRLSQERLVLKESVFKKIRHLASKTYLKKTWTDILLVGLNANIS
jgi:hypothetical protein